MSMPMALGFGLSGQPFVGADIGGFQGTRTPSCSCAGCSTAYSPLLPQPLRDRQRRPVRLGVRRGHRGPGPRRIQLRYRLLPYLYAAFVRRRRTGAPVQRPLVFDYQYDPTVRDIDDQYLFGADLLVAPVTRPARPPARCTCRRDLVRLAHRRAVGGRRFLLAPAPMERIPLYARGGAVIPMWPEAPPSTADYHPRVIELHLFIPEDGEYHSFLHEDDGLTFAFRAGAFYRTAFCVCRNQGLLTVEALVSGNGYPEFAREEFLIVLHGPPIQRITIDGRDMSVHDSTIRLPNSGQPFTLTAELAG